MDNRSLSSLLALLDQPILLRLHIASLRDRKDLDESVLGFIALYDACAGDCTQIKKQLNATKQSVLSPLVPKKKSSVHLLKYAAIFVILGLSSLGLILLINSNRVELSHKFKDPGLPNYMGTSASVDLSEAMFYYKKNDFEKAKTSIRRIQKSHPNNDTVRYYNALISFEVGEREFAIEQFERVAKQNSKYVHRANYFIAVNAAEVNHYSKAMRIFKKLTNCEDEFVRAAAKLHLRELRQYLH